MDEKHHNHHTPAMGGPTGFVHHSQHLIGQRKAKQRDDAEDTVENARANPDLIVRKTGRYYVIADTKYKKLKKQRG